MAEIETQHPKGTEIRVCFVAPEAEKDLWKCCGWESVKGWRKKTECGGRS